MFLAQITFGSDRGKQDQRESLSDSAESYLAALRHNGQLCTNYFFAWSGGRLIAYAHVARPDSLANRHHSAWSLSELEVVAKAFGQSPTCKIIDDVVPTRFASWKRSTSFYLFMHAFYSDSPVCCGDSGSPIPLYQLPLPQESRESLYFWAGSSKDHDRIQLGCGALEMPAYKQLADPQSELSQIGRELCAEVERSTNKPTYYYLHRYWGRRVGEEKRRCPLCGKKWHVSGRLDNEQPFYLFPFRCERCRLVSHFGDSQDNERHARIGEFKKVK